MDFTRASRTQNLVGKYLSHLAKCRARDTLGPAVLKEHHCVHFRIIRENSLRKETVHKCPIHSVLFKETNQYNALQAATRPFAMPGWNGSQKRNNGVCL